VEVDSVEVNMEEEAALAAHSTDNREEGSGEDQALVVLVRFEEKADFYFVVLSPVRIEVLIKRPFENSTTTAHFEMSINRLFNI
jgi:hypothetical protein